MTKPKPTKAPKAVTRAAPCPPCDGTGKLKVKQETFGQNGDMTSVERTVPCAQCGGTGRWYVDKEEE